jgi:hypothetical protein
MPTCETHQARLRVRPAKVTTFAGRVSKRSKFMKAWSVTRGLSVAGLIAAATPCLAVSLSALGPQNAPPEAVAPRGAPAHALVDNWTAGSAALIPVVATDAQAHPISTVDSPADGGSPAGKPVDDIQFVKQATENGRAEVQSASDALPRLQKPELRQIAERHDRFRRQMDRGDDRGAREIRRAVSRAGDGRGRQGPAQIRDRDIAHDRTPPGTTQELAEMNGTDNGRLLTMRIIKLLGIAGIAILAASFVAARTQRREDEHRRRLNEEIERERWESEGGASRSGPATQSAVTAH